MKHLVAPSILSADFARLGDAVGMLDASDADWIHCDVMDGRFVPNISFGMPVLKAVKRIARKPLDVHLMIAEPERYLADFKAAGADHLTIHAEACMHLDRTLRAIRELGMRPGIALNPATPVESIEYVLPLADIVCLMSVNPGFGGQSFLHYVSEKVTRLRTMAQAARLRLHIEVDGGINADTGSLMLQAGADVLIAGSYVFDSPDPPAVIAGLKRLRHS
ncbi:MAG: ribulose-phosphate 3-epimerase [Bacteroidia bacterium]|nr:ribulose-phosphate 3-epimerase [Bacteroidia bacterium]